MPDTENVANSWKRHVHSDYSQIKARVADFANDYEAMQLAALAQLKINAAFDPFGRYLLVSTLALTGYPVLLTLTAGVGAFFRPAWLLEWEWTPWIGLGAVLAVWAGCIWLALWLWRGMKRETSSRSCADFWFSIYTAERERRFAATGPEAEAWKKLHRIEWDTPPRNPR